MSHVGLKAFARSLGDRRLKACALGCFASDFDCLEASIVGHLVAVLIAPLSLTWYAPTLQRFLLSLLSFSLRPSTVQTSPPRGALRRRLSLSTSSSGRGCQSSPDLALASPPRGSIFLQHRKDDVQRG
jgi:hypothetical protein